MMPGSPDPSVHQDGQLVALSGAANGLVIFPEFIARCVFTTRRDVRPLEKCGVMGEYVGRLAARRSTNIITSSIFGMSLDFRLIPHSVRVTTGYSIPLFYWHIHHFERSKRITNTIYKI